MDEIFGYFFLRPAAVDRRRVRTPCTKEDLAAGDHTVCGALAAFMKHLRRGPKKVRSPLGLIVAILCCVLAPVMNSQGANPQGTSPITNAPSTTAAPEIVRLVIKRAGSELAGCTGIVLTRRIILTAAHCVQGAMGIKVYFYTVLNSSGSRVYPSTDVFGPAAFIPHPDFDGSPLLSTNNNDIAVIRLRDPGMSTYEPARIYFDNRIPWKEYSGEEGRVDAFGIGTGSPPGSSADCGAGTSDGTKRHATRIYVAGVQYASVGTRKIIATMDGQHLCPGDSGGAWTLRRNGRYLTFAIHYDHTDFWWYQTAYGTSIRAYWEWAISRANDADVSLACPTTVPPGSGYRYKKCRENLTGSECTTGQTKHRSCSANQSGPGVDFTCVAGFWKGTGGGCEPKAPPGGQPP